MKKLNINDPSGVQGQSPWSGVREGALRLKALSLFAIQWDGKTFAISVFCSLLFSGIFIIPHLGKRLHLGVLRLLSLQ